jgi:acid phosphatase type 7
MSRQSRPAASSAVSARTSPDTTPGRETARRKTALTQVTQRRPVAPDESFVALPPPSGRAPYRRRLADVIGHAQARAITESGVLRFHAVGDTGGHLDPRPQRRVAAAMVSELAGDTPARFFYHLGDVVYPHGEESNYSPQFFSAYADYTGPIFAVPGNHDAEAPSVSLGGFVKTFCSDMPPLHDAGAPVPRPSPRQPHVYWTLVHDWLRIIGLYSNVPEGGQFADEQLRWLTQELRSSPAEATVLLAMHQPVYAADVTHGSNLTLADSLDDCFAEAGRVPDAVFTGHAHNYQRFARRLGDRAIPYIVAGAGGYHERHAIGAGLPALPASFPGLDDVTLQAYEDQAHGFMTVTSRRGGADVVYTAVTRDKAAAVDCFAIGAATT